MTRNYVMSKFQDPWIHGSMDPPSMRIHGSTEQWIHGSLKFQWVITFVQQEFLNSTQDLHSLRDLFASQKTSYTNSKNSGRYDYLNIAKIQRSMDPVDPKPKDPPDPWIRIHGSVNISTLSKDVNEAHGSGMHGSRAMDPWIHGSMDPSPGSTDPWIQIGCVDPWASSMDPDPWVMVLLEPVPDPWISRFLIHGYYKF